MTDLEELENQVCNAIAEKIELRDLARSMLTALMVLRTRFHTCCIAAGNHPTIADLACESTDAAIAAAMAAGIEEQ